MAKLPTELFEKQTRDLTAGTKLAREIMVELSEGAPSEIIAEKIMAVRKLVRANVETALPGPEVSTTIVGGKTTVERLSKDSSSEGIKPPEEGRSR